MSARLSVLQGGKLRWNAPTNPATTYSRGQAIYINSLGQLTQYDGSQNANVGLALETVVSTATGNPFSNTQTVVQGKTGSILLGEAVVSDDNLSGVGFNVGDNVWAQSGGLLTNVSGLGTWFLGKTVVSSASNGILQFQMRPALGGAA